MFGWLGRSLWVGLFCGGPTIQQCPTENLHGWQIVTQLSERHGSRISLVVVIRTRNQGFAKRLGASPNRPVWTCVAVEAPKLRRLRVPSSRWIRQLDNVRRAILCPSQPGVGPRVLHQCARWPNGATFGCLDGWSHRHGYTNRHPNGFWMLFGCLLVTLSMLTDGPFPLIQAHPKEFWMQYRELWMLSGTTLDVRSEAMA